MIIPKPMKAPTEPINLRKDLDPKKYYYVQPKYDGIRSKFHAGVPYTNTSKHIPNTTIANAMRDIYNKTRCGLNLDGELLLWNPITNSWRTFNECQSVIMSSKRLNMVNAQDWRFVIFDYDDGAKMQTYAERLFKLVDLFFDSPSEHLKLVEYATHLPIPGHDVDAIEQACRFIISQGYEGAMIRDSESRYMYGKLPASTTIIRKYVDWVRDEATIVGVVEGNRNMDTTTKRIANMVPANRMGALIVRNHKFGQFEIGSGFNDLDRDKFWRERVGMVGLTVTFKYRPDHMKDVPCPAIYVGLRSREDMSE